jgi:hypothetical protein
MNCQEFDVIVLDLVRGNLKATAARRDGMAHASNCRGCAERLSQERVLSAGLQAWAESSGRSQVPERLEAALLAAFRAHAPLRAAHRVTESRPARLKFAAAGIMIFLAATLAFLEDGRVRGPSPSPFPPAAGKVSASPVAAATQIESESERRPVKETAQPRPAAQAKRQIARAAGARAASNRAEEITTGFIPLPYGSSLNLWEEGPSAKIHLIRMRLPRSALLTTGLPMNEERANEPVLADVLFTEDGLARGIRFVN